MNLSQDALFVGDKQKFEPMYLLPESLSLFVNIYCLPELGPYVSSLSNHENLPSGLSPSVLSCTM